MKTLILVLGTLTIGSSCFADEIDLTAGSSATVSVNTPTTVKCAGGNSLPNCTLSINYGVYTVTAGNGFSQGYADQQGALSEITTLRNAGICQ
jgi:hypothetical protein